MVNFVCFSKRHSKSEGHLRLFCLNDDKLDKTLEAQENFEKIAISKLIEVGEGCEIGIEVSKNFEIISKSKDKLIIKFKPFIENRLSVNLRIKNFRKIGEGFINLIINSSDGEYKKKVICSLPIRFSSSDEYNDDVDSDDDDIEVDEESNTVNNIDESIKDIGMEDIEHRITEMDTPDTKKPTELNLNELGLKLTDIAGSLGDDWEKLADRLKTNDAEINNIRASYDFHGEKALVYFHHLLNIDPPIKGKFIIFTY